MALADQSNASRSSCLPSFLPFMTHLAGDYTPAATTSGAVVDVEGWGCSVDWPAGPVNATAAVTTLSAGVHRD